MAKPSAETYYVSVTDYLALSLFTTLALVFVHIQLPFSELLSHLLVHLTRAEHTSD